VLLAGASLQLAGAPDDGEALVPGEGGQGGLGGARGMVTSDRAPSGPSGASCAVLEWGDDEPLCRATEEEVR
jgi:hypothetical protein